MVVNAQGERGETPLIVAAECTGVGVTNPLRGLAVAWDTQRVLQPGDTLLPFPPDTLSAILAAGADVNARDRHGRTALLCAIDARIGGEAPPGTGQVAIPFEPWTLTLDLETSDSDYACSCYTRMRVSCEWQREFVFNVLARRADAKECRRSWNRSRRSPAFVRMRR